MNIAVVKLLVLIIVWFGAGYLIGFTHARRIKKSGKRNK